MVSGLSTAIGREASTSSVADREECESTGHGSVAMSTWTTARALDHREASLHPQHSSVSRLSGPPYWVTPRHLAGDDDALADQVGAVLAAAGWRRWPTARDTLLYANPHGLFGGEWTRAACSSNW
jgi:hypothetical protein